MGISVCLKDPGFFYFETTNENENNWIREVSLGLTGLWRTMTDQETRFALFHDKIGIHKYHFDRTHRTAAINC